MPSIQYNGVAPIHETAITGKQQKWFPGQIQQVSDADAALLKASGLGFVNEQVAPGDLTPATTAALQAMVSGDWNPVVYEGDAAGLQEAVSSAVTGVRIAASLTTGVSISVPAGVVVEVPAGVVVTRTGSGADAFVAAGAGARVVGAGRITGGRYGFNSAGYAGCVVAGLDDSRRLRIDSTASHGVWIDGQGCEASFLDVEAGQSGIALSGASGCRIHDNYVNDCTNFGIWVTSASHNNHIYRNSCDVSGLELVGVTYDCHDNHIYENKARSTGDNGISVTGYRNVVMNNECSGNQNHGIGIYGERNTVVGNYGRGNGLKTLVDSGQYAGITCTPAFGGLARKNVIVGNHFDDDAAQPTQYSVVKIASDAYVAWGSGQSVVNANLYRKNGVNVYRATAPGTTGATAPTHTAGDVSDGGVTWRWVCSSVNSLARSYAQWATGVVITEANRYQRNDRVVYRADAIGGTTGATAPTHTTGSASDGAVSWTVYEECPANLDAYDNTVIGNAGSGNIVADPVLDLTTNRQLYISAGRMKIPAPGRNQAGDVICSTGTPEAVVSARPGSIYMRQDVSAPGIAIWFKQSGTGNTGWLRATMQDGGTTALRPALSSYGTGARGYAYFDTTISKPIWWSGSAWVDATGTAA